MPRSIDLPPDIRRIRPDLPGGSDGCWRAAHCPSRSARAMPRGVWRPRTQTDETVIKRARRRARRRRLARGAARFGPESRALVRRWRACVGARRSDACTTSRPGSAL